MILAIDTSGGRCGAALWNERLVDYWESDSYLRHNEILIAQIRDLLSQHHIKGESLAAIAVSAGPGSFTGLRVGMATAKGLCWTWKLPLVSVPTLGALASAAPPRLKRALPLMPARSREVYFCLYEYEAGTWQAKGTCAVAEIHTLADLVTGNVFLCGEGYERHETRLNDLFADRRLSLHESESLEPSVVSTARLAARRFQAAQFEDLLRAEPLYHYPFPIVKASAPLPPKE